MKKNKKIFGIFVTIITIFLFGITKADAATGTIKITSNKSQIVVGNTVTYTVTVSSNTGMVALQYNISYDSSQLSLTSGSAAGAPVFSKSTKSVTYTFKFKAKKAGTANFSFSANGATWDGDSEVKFTTASKSVKIITQQQLEDSYSKNNNLSSLGVENATLSPAFSSSITSYTVNLPANTESIKVTGKKADSEASVSGLGEHAVVDGKNTIKVVVTAENGATKTYTITAIVEELDPINVIVDETEYSIIRKEKLLDPPSSDFIHTTTTINEQEVPTLTNEKIGIVLIGLKDSDGNIILYVYEAENNSYIKYNQLSFKNVTLYIENKNVENTDNYEELSFDEKTINGYTIKNDDFYYFYAINLETGKENLYRYDKEENTVQRTDPIKKEEEITNKPNKNTNTEDVKLYQYTILGLIAFIFLTYIIILINLIHKNKKSKNNVIIVTDGNKTSKTKNSNDDKETIATKIEETDSKETKLNTTSNKEKDKIELETQEEIRRINNENTSDTNEVVDSINELLDEEDKKKKKKKEKVDKKKKSKTDKNN